jgi:membrane-associated protease RseP (regulator of RpoE activity)
MPAYVGVLIFAFVVLLVIVAHESGHFFAAKAFGIKVEEFFVGFGPRLWSFRRGETEYGLKAIPAGGYVRIAGMNPFQELAPEDLPRTFGAKPPWQRAIVLLAGSFTHFVLALIFLAVFFGAIGIPDRFAPRVAAVETTLEGQPSPAAEAGLLPGDEFVEVDGRPVRSYEEFVDYTRDRAGQELDLVVDRDGDLVTLRATPVLAPVDGELVGRLGVTLAAGSVLERDRANPVVAVGRAAQTTGDMIVASFRSMGRSSAPPVWPGSADNFSARSPGPSTGTPPASWEPPACQARRWRRDSSTCCSFCSPGSTCSWASSTFFHCPRSTAGTWRWSASRSSPGSESTCDGSCRSLRSSRVS